MNSYTEKSVSTFRLMNRRQRETSRARFIVCLLITGLFCFTSYAANWKVLPIRSEYEYNEGLTGGEAMQLPHGIARSESNPNYIYWNHDNSGPWMSFNGGDSWRRCLSKGIYQGNAGSIAVDPVNYLRVFALESQLWYGDDAKFDGLYQSVDGGENWTLVLQKTVGLDWGKHRYIARNIAFDRSTMGSTKTTTMYVAMYYRDELPRWDPNDGGLYKSTDGGDSWTQIVNSTIDKYYQITCGSGNVYLATDEGLKVYTEGSSYSALGDLPSGAVTSVFVHPTTQTTIYATVYHDGLYKSTNGGTNFTKIPLDDGSGGFSGEATYVYSGFYNNAYPDTIYVTGDSKGTSTWVTHDAGANWVWNDNTNNVPVGKYSVRMYGPQAGVVSSATDVNDAIGFGNGNIYKTNDGGVIFNESATLFTGYSTVYQTSFAFDKYNPNRFALGFADVGYYITNTGGAWFWRNWNTSDGSSIDDWKTACYIPCTGATIYCSCIDFSPTEGSETMISSVGYGTSNKANSRMMYLEDEETGWALQTDYVPDSPPDPYPYWIRFAQYHRTNSSVVYLSDAISTNGGKSYTAINFTPYTEYDYLGAPAEIVAQSPSDPNTIYATYKFGQDVIRSNSKGDTGTWELVGSPAGKMYRQTPIITFAVHPTNPNLYYTLDEEGDLASYDTETNTSTSLGVLDLVEHEETQLIWVKNVVLDPRYPNIIYASIAGKSIENMWRSSDAGATWENISSNLPRIGSFNIAVSPLTGELLAGGLCGTYVLPPPYAGNTPIYDNACDISINDSAPVLALIGNKSVNENIALSFSVSATDADNDTITYSATGLPTGATFASQNFSWTPGYTQAGTYQVTFTASDGNDQDSEQITITVNNTNRAPVLASIGDKSVDENSSLSFSVSATDADSDTITYSATGLPTGAMFTGPNFSWTPGYAQAGTYQVTFIASDGTASDSEQITITVSNTNRTPVLASIGDKSVDENSALSFPVSATDADGGIITYSVQSLPTGAVFGSQTFTWTPGYNQAGTYNVTFTASDSQAQDSEIITITVSNVNRAPVLASIGDKSVFIENPLTFTISATDADDDTITYSATNLPSGATFTGQNFSWTPASSQAGSYDVTFTASDSTDQDSEVITITVTADSSAPAVTNLSPAADSIQTPLNSLIYLDITDSGKGVDASTVTIEVNGNLVYTADTANYNSSYGHCRRIGTSAAYKYIYQADEKFDYGQTVTVTVNATDLASNPMDEYEYSFNTEMRSFGENKKVNSRTNNLNESSPATASDNSGNIWTVWHTGQTGSRDIYIGKLTAGADTFSSSVQIANNDGDQCNPVIAIDSADKLYVAWQDSRNGEWDIYLSTSVDGTNFSTERKITDPNSNQINPAIAVDSSKVVYVAWEDDQNSNSDIYIASSTNSFVSKTTSQITSNTSAQTSPAIAVDSGNTVYVVWTDVRGGTSDIYGADSTNGPWTNVAVVSNANNQSSPAIAAESTGSILHLLWADDTPGDNDIYYASSNGLPGSSLTGSSLIDDESDASQSAPVITVTGSTGNNLKVFACWKDDRNVSSGNGDTDLYFVEVNSDSGTNVLVGDNSTNSAQNSPAMGIDGYGYPYLVWTDGRNTSTDIYYAGSTFVESTALESQDVTASSGVTIGTELASISSVTDVSVTIPVAACSHDATITISRVKNLQKVSLDNIGAPYEFGPSGMEFDQPVTIIIPYDVSIVGNSPSAYWYNPLTNVLSQQGITNVEIIKISGSLRALRFETTHFTQFLIGSGIAAAAGGGGGGGGGCSMSPDSRGSIIEFLLPYIGLAVVMTILKLKDKRKKKMHDIAKTE